MSRPAVDCAGGDLFSLAGDDAGRFVISLSMAAILMCG